MHFRDVAIVKMQIGAADRGRGDFHNSVPRIFNLGIRYGIAPNVILTVPDKGFHSDSPRKIRREKTFDSYNVPMLPKLLATFAAVRVSSPRLTFVAQKAL
jgi:hypothetical protein